MEREGVRYTEGEREKGEKQKERGEIHKEIKGKKEGGGYIKREKERENGMYDGVSMFQSLHYNTSD